MQVNTIPANPAAAAGLRRLPVADWRLDGMAAAPADAMTLLQWAIERTDKLAALIRRAAPAPEITAAAEAVAAISTPLESLEIIVGALITAHRAGEAYARGSSPVSRPRLSEVPAVKDAPGGAA